MNELEIQSRIRLALGQRPDLRLFRNVSTHCYTGRPVSQAGGLLTLADAHPIRAGLFVGSSDLIGWRTKTINVLNPDGTIKPTRVAVFASVEVKTPRGKTSPEQDTWLAAVHNAGGIQGVVRSVEDAERLFP